MKKKISYFIKSGFMILVFVAGLFFGFVKETKAARLFTSGFEQNSTSAGIELDAVGGSPIIDSTTKRSGSYALEVDTSSATASMRYQYAAGGTTDDTYFRCYFYIDTAPSSGGPYSIFQLYDTTAAGQVAAVRLNTDQTLELWGYNTQLGLDSSSLVTARWYRIEVSVVGTTITGYINGIQFATGSANASYDDSNRFDVGAITSGTMNLHFDDLAINDQTGSNQNSLSGEGRVIQLNPGSAGDAYSFMKSTAAIGDSNNYTNVDENPPDAADYVKANNVQSYGAAGTYNWVAPAGVTSVDVELLAGGGGGGRRTSNGNGGGGGGGAYVKSTNVPVTPGNTYVVVVGAAGSGLGGNGGNSTFNGTTVVAEGGLGAGVNIATGARGGRAANSTYNSVGYDGGDGWTNTGSGGGGGGSSASSSSAGNNATSATGATAVGDGGPGGNGRTGTSGAGSAPSTSPGGGGGGAYRSGSGSYNGGAGMFGRAKLTYVMNDMHNVADSGIGTSNTVNVVHVGMRYSGTSTSANSGFKLQIKKTSGGTISSSSEITPTNATWYTNAAASPKNPPLTLYNDPDGSAWTKTTIDSMQIGYAISTANTNYSSVATVWATVDYTNAIPTLSVSQPPSGSTMVGSSYDITYTLADSDDSVTAAFYYDTNNDGSGGTAITGNCATAAEGTNATCSFDTSVLTPGTPYYIYGVTNDGTNYAVTAVSAGTITVNNKPTISSINDSPDPVAPGNDVTFSANWSDSDAGETVKMFVCKTNVLTSQSVGGCAGGSWYYSPSYTNTVPQTGTYTAQVADIGTNNYYVFICDVKQASNSCSSSSSGTFEVQNNSLSTDIVDSGGTPVSSPSVTFSSKNYSFETQTTTGTLASSDERIRVSNPTATAAWTVSLAGSAPGAHWTSGGNTYHFDDSTGSGYTNGQMTIDPSGGTISGVGGCSTSGTSVGASDSFENGVRDSIDIFYSTAASTSCSWDYVGASDNITQKIPANQLNGSYSLNMVLTIL